MQVHIPFLVADGPELQSALGRRVEVVVPAEGGRAKTVCRSFNYDQCHTCNWKPGDAPRYVSSVTPADWPDNLLSRGYARSIHQLIWCFDHLAPLTQRALQQSVKNKHPITYASVPFADLPKPSKMMRIAGTQPDAGDGVPPSHFSAVRLWLFGRRGGGKTTKKEEKDIAMFRFLAHFNDPELTAVFTTFRQYVRLHLTPELVMPDLHGEQVEQQCQAYLAMGRKLNTEVEAAFTEEQRVWSVACHYYTCHAHEVHALVPVASARTEGDERLHHFFERVYSAHKAWRTGRTQGICHVLTAVSGLRKIATKSVARKALRSARKREGQRLNPRQELQKEHARRRQQASRWRPGKL